MRYVLAVLHIAIFGLPLWIARLLINLPLWFLGLVLIPWQSAYTEIRPSKYYAGRNLPQFKARWMWIFGNEEDGIDGLRGGDAAQFWWAKMTSADSVRMRIFKWSARRNPINNLRYVPLLSPRFHPDQIEFVGGYIWQGVYARLVLDFKGQRFSIGWKFRPEDQQGIAVTDTRLPRCDFGARRQNIDG